MNLGSMRVWTSVVLVHGAISMLTNANAQLSLGTLVGCEGANYETCFWADSQGNAVGRHEAMRQLMAAEKLDIEDVDEIPRRRLEMHMQYVEDVYRHARHLGVSFPYAMGVNERHLYLDDTRTQSPREFVQQEAHASRRRRLEEQERPQEKLSRELQSLPASLDWCSTDNPLKKNVCTPVKSQNKCGSCWAFAASDAIETAVAVGSDTPPLALSPQQFLDCSRRQMTATFQYCWAENGVNGAPWLLKEMKWASENNGCDGGMTHGAFADAAILQLGLLSELVLPYTETTTDLTLVPGFRSTATHAPKSEAQRNKSCVHTSSNASATISDWTQAVGKDCGPSNDQKQLLRLALQKQPISVAINSGSTFKDYKGGIYQCPNNGDFVDSTKVDHAIVLVGYGNEGGVDYWIVKNSYGFSWGEKGFMRIAADQKINCGLSIFPVIPLGATKGAAKLVIQGGGDNLMLGLSPFMWCALAAVVTIGTAVLTFFGAIVQRRRRSAMRKDAVMG
jgi:cathepsin L